MNFRLPFSMRFKVCYGRNTPPRPDRGHRMLGLPSKARPGQNVLSKDKAITIVDNYNSGGCAFNLVQYLKNWQAARPLADQRT